MTTSTSGKGSASSNSGNGIKTATSVVATLFVLAILANYTNVYVVVAVAYAAAIFWLYKEQKQHKAAIEKDEARPRKVIRLIMACGFVAITTMVTISAIFMQLTSLIQRLFGA